jgi:hypothetical protein
MLSPYIYGALAHERHQTFLAQAETDRRARQARLHRQQAGAPVTALVAADNPAMAGLLRKVRADFVCHDPGALRYEILLGPAEQYRPAGVFRSGDDPPGRLADPAAPESASVTMVTETHRTKARRGADRVWSFDSYSGWAQRRAGAAGLVLSAGSRMKAVVRWAKYRIALRGCDRSEARGSVARGGPGAEGSANDGHSCLWGG